MRTVFITGITKYRKLAGAFEYLIPHVVVFPDYKLPLDCPVILVLIYQTHYIHYVVNIVYYPYTTDFAKHFWFIYHINYIIHTATGPGAVACLLACDNICLESEIFAWDRTVDSWGGEKSATWKEFSHYIWPETPSSWLTHDRGLLFLSVSIYLAPGKHKHEWCGMSMSMSGKVWDQIISNSGGKLST
jgi:diaminopimelate epimerase